MFESLATRIVPTPDPIVQKKPDKRTARLRLKAMGSAQKQAVALATLVANLAKMTAITKDFTDLRLLRSVTNAHGLSKPLMRFVNPNNQGIGRIIQNLPATESFDMVAIGKTDDRVKTALEGIDAVLTTEPALVADWVRTGADNMDAMLTATSPQMKALGHAISDCLEGLEDAAIDADDVATSVIEALPQDQMADCIAALLSVFPDLDCKVSDPTDRDAMDAHHAKMGGLLDKCAEHTGLCFDADNRYQVCMGAMPESCQPTTAPLGELGYTRENTIALLKQADALVDEVQGLIERKDTMVGHFNETATTCETLDNDVPPAVDGAIPETDDDGTVQSGMTQVDVIHCHVSSYLCCICSTIEAANRAVQTVLAVAHCLCGLTDDDDDADSEVDGTDGEDDA